MKKHKVQNSYNFKERSLENVFCNNKVEWNALSRIVDMFYAL